MTIRFTSRTILLSTCVAVAFSAASVQAGECPADQIADGARTSGETAPVGVTDTVLSAIDPSDKGPAFAGHMLRLRRLEIAAGGVVPWHSHETRAANIMITEGEIVEYSSTCKVGITHKAGDVVGEYGEGLARWWKNEGTAPVVILSADLLPPEMPAETM